MALSTFSSFYYSLEINVRNNILNFDEGAGELAAEIQIGSFTTETLAVAVETALNATGALTYSVSFDRVNRLYTITADGAFDLLIATGTQLGVSIFPTIGFTGADLTGLLTYQGNTAAGKVYLPQFILQSYKTPDMMKGRVAASINEAASGDLEVVSFGIRRFTEFSIKYITNKIIKGQGFRPNATGFDDAVDFLTYLSSKGPFEFMPNSNDTSTFFTVIVESMPGNSDGVGYELKELVGKNLPDFYEIDGIKCRVLD